MIKHIVFIKFKKENKEQNILKVKELLESLPSKIECLINIEIGINFDNTSRAMDLSLYSIFENKDDFNTYATHKEHLKVVSVIKECSEYTKVVDYTI
ncbi:Stress responsive alpha-beta barrel domain protein Dabb [hydrothermal vent metagenome]|uniref:Stress responsive alpha-beta barrel domain protein Dabb n=1 Tax=hydrothermal vent metagenome TaxID=652676 RepID=A0A3B1DUA7_9ZZZZ